ncbi:MAG TPA: glycosyltransferase family 4 protein [Gallionellaceae bacterium]
MRLLFVGTNRGGGGTESHFVTLARSLHDAGHEVAAVVYPGAPISIGLQGSGVQLIDGVFRNAFDPRGFSTVWRTCSSFQPDWIIGSFSKEYWPLALLARLRGIRLALFKHMDFPMRPATNYFIPRLATRFIVISDFMRKRFIARGIPPERLQVLHNPLDLAHFQLQPGQRDESRARLGYGESDVVLGFVGALHPDKGIFQLADSLNQAMAQNPHIKAMWIGEGPGDAELKARIQTGGFAERHTQHGWTPDVRPYYAAMDMLAMCSVGGETFGRVSVEAQACGVPVLCSDNGGIPETLQPGTTGLLLPPGDVAAWRDAILKLAQDAALRKQMAAGGREWVAQQFSAPVIVRQFGVLLQKN